MFINIINLIFLSSCKTETDSVECKIRGENFKYWILVWYDSHKGENLDYLSDYNSIRLFYFDINYKRYGATKYNFSTSNLSFDNKSLDDVQTSNSWFLKNDSVIDINNRRYKIEILTTDMMLLYDSLNMREFLYVVAPDSLIPEANRKILFDK